MGACHRDKNMPRGGSEEVATCSPRLLLNEKIVLFRSAGGDVGALEDCCCHRAAPLSLGEILGDYLACGYHGLKFDVNGKCVEVPARTQVPSGAKVRSYPIAEKWNVVWIWMGDPAKVEPGKIPDMPWLSEPKPARWLEVPAPGDSTLILPGLALA